MKKNTENRDETAACGGGGGSCCRGSGRWIWIILALAVVGVMVVKNSGKQEVAPVAPAVIQTKALPRLVDLGAGKCIPCKMMAPILEDLSKTLAGKLEVQFIDVWQNPDAGKKYGINVIPTQIFYDAAGKELFRHEGFFSREDIIRKWGELGVELSEKSEVRSQKSE